MYRKFTSVGVETNMYFVHKVLRARDVRGTNYDVTDICKFKRKPLVVNRTQQRQPVGLSSFLRKLNMPPLFFFGAAWWNKDARKLRIFESENLGRREWR
jgi:hypothetical protein